MAEWDTLTVLTELIELATERAAYWLGSGCWTEGCVVCGVLLDRLRFVLGGRDDGPLQFLAWFPTF
jgi:hypothetical protein